MNGDQLSGFTDVLPMARKNRITAEFDDDDNAGGPRTFFDADDQNDRDEQHNDGGRDVGHPTLCSTWRMSGPIGQFEPGELEEIVEVAGPADCHRDTGHAVF